MEERFLATGANGCIGAWVAAQLHGEGVPDVAAAFVAAARRGATGALVEDIGGPPSPPSG